MQGKINFISLLRPKPYASARNNSFSAVKCNKINLRVAGQWDRFEFALALFADSNLMDMNTGLQQESVSVGSIQITDDGVAVYRSGYTLRCGQVGQHVTTAIDTADKLIKLRAALLCGSFE